MNVVFRADANTSVGMGHIMRCLSIADAFRDAGHRVSFVMADDTVDGFVRNRGYKAIILHSNYTRLAEEMWPSMDSDLIIVDSYYATFQYLSDLKKRMSVCGGKLAYLDDIYSFPYPVDFLINYNAYSSQAVYEELYSGIKMPSMILGPRYAPLRSMFKGIERSVQPKTVKNVLISTGGSDGLHFTVNILRALVEQQKCERRYHILIGSMNTDRETIYELAEKREFIVLHENIKNMKGLITDCDLAISAAGSTLYEICACGIPLITYAMADNQISGAEAFGDMGMGINIGDLRAPNSACESDRRLVSDGVERILNAAEALASNYKRRCEMGTKMQELIDGYGADRMVQKLMEMCNRS